MIQTNLKPHQHNPNAKFIFIIRDKQEKYTKRHLVEAFIPPTPHTHSPPASSAWHRAPCLPLWRACGRRQTCPAGLCAAPRGEQSLGFCLRAGGRPGRSPLGRTLPFGPAARPPPAACQHLCKCSTWGRAKEKEGWINPGKQDNTSNVKSRFWSGAERKKTDV